MDTIDDDADREEATDDEAGEVIDFAAKRAELRPELDADVPEPTRDEEDAPAPGAEDAPDTPDEALERLADALGIKLERHKPRRDDDGPS